MQNRSVLMIFYIFNSKKYFKGSKQEEKYMGYMTVISILNDGWTSIQNNPEELVKQIDTGMDQMNPKTVTSHSVGNRYPSVFVGRSMHADNPQLMLACRNFMTSFHTPGDYMNVSEEFSRFSKNIAIAEETLDFARRTAEEKAANMVADDIRAAGKNPEEMEADEIKEFVEKNKWVKAIPWNRKVNWVRMIRNVF